MRRSMMAFNRLSTRTRGVNNIPPQRPIAKGIQVTGLPLFLSAQSCSVDNKKRNRKIPMQLPPGLDDIYSSGSYPPISNFDESATGGADTHEWCKFHKTRLYTNVFIWKPQEGKILLGYKKRGFGQGMYNGFGGKVEPSEAIASAALRELEEEAGIRAPLQHCGTLLFYDPQHDFAHHIDIFKAQEFSGTITESDEMRPEWFCLPGAKSNFPPLPSEKMWPDDEFWIPLMLENRFFIGRVDFKGDVMVRWWFAAETGANIGV